MFKQEETQIRQVQKLHCKYASVLSYIALLNKEIARNAAILEAKREMRRSEKTKHENKAGRVCQEN